MKFLRKFRNIDLNMVKPGSLSEVGTFTSVKDKLIITIFASFGSADGICDGVFELVSIIIEGVPDGNKDASTKNDGITVGWSIVTVADGCQVFTEDANGMGVGDSLGVILLLVVCEGG